MKLTTQNFLRQADIFGKWIDQPALIKKVSGKVPAVLISSATAFGLYDTFNNKKVKSGEESKLKRFVKNASILSSTVASTLIFGKKFIHMPHHCGHTLENVITGVKDNKAVKSMLGKMKSGEILNRKEVKTVYEYFEKQGKEGKELLSKVFPIGHEHAHGKGFWGKHPEFAEIKDLSILGTIPVVGGIAGGAAGDMLTGENLGETMPDKIKEGSYQYLANIVLCNVGAGAALYGVNRWTPHKNNKPVKFMAMLGGILAVGVAGGSMIANYIGRKVINPMLNHHHGKRHKHQNIYQELYQERTPEAVDIGLHIDDVAAAGFLSGMNVIAPILPILYSVSAYRAGIGYRNNEDKQAMHFHHGKRAAQINARLAFPASGNKHPGAMRAVNDEVFREFRHKRRRLQANA